MVTAAARKTVIVTIATRKLMLTLFRLISLLPVALFLICGALSGIRYYWLDTVIVTWPVLHISIIIVIRWCSQRRSVVCVHHGEPWSTWSSPTVSVFRGRLKTFLPMTFTRRNICGAFAVKVVILRHCNHSFTYILTWHECWRICWRRHQPGSAEEPVLTIIMLDVYIQCEW